MSLETTAKDWLSDPAWNRVRDIENMLQCFLLNITIVDEGALKRSFLIQFNSYIFCIKIKSKQILTKLVY